MDDQTVEEIVRLKRIIWKIEDEVEADIIRKAYRRKLMQDMAEGKALPPVLRMAQQRIGAEHFVKPEKLIKPMFITISAKDDVDVSAFWRQMEKVTKKKSLSGTGRYVIEQRSEGEQQPYGWHIHWLLTPTVSVSKSVCVQQVYQCFQRFVAAANYIDVRPVVGSLDAINAYMSGQKSEEKMQKVEKDRVLRQVFGFPSEVSY